MITPDWTLLTPHRPLDPGDADYAERPDRAAATIADLVRAGKSTILVAGPVGVGKSTEIARAALLLQTDRVACLVQLDRALNMRTFTVEDALYRIAGRLAWLAIAILGLEVSGELREPLIAQGVLGPEHRREGPSRARIFSPRDLLTALLREVARLSRQGRIALLVDGTEKCPESRDDELFDALRSLPDDVDLVVIVPWRRAYGPGASEVVRQGEKLISVRALPQGESDRDGAGGFLIGLLERRLRLPEGSLDSWRDPANPSIVVPSEARLAIALATAESGGIPRMFLQLVGDAATYARLRRREPWPNLEDLEDAKDDLKASFRRVLLPGDVEALSRVRGTDGLEMDFSRKVRLLAHAVLLEREGQTGPIMMPHPLVQDLLQPVP